MEKEKKKYYAVPDCPPVRPSLLSTLEKVKAQIDYEGLNTKYDFNTGRRIFQENQQMREICMIIAETLIIQPEKEIAVNGDKMPAGIVQEVFGLLTNSHIELVLDSFNSTTNLITNKKVYIRTALYNSVFELDSHYKNIVLHDMSD
jgi:rRNA processing protein Gar1